ncbi:hypothetical protein SAMN06295998_13518, partial [Primorskyibacter flagellatus]
WALIMAALCAAFIPKAVNFLSLRRIRLFSLNSLTRWRKRIGEEGAEWLLTKTIEVGRTSGAVDAGSLSRVAVDTTVMEKNIAHPTDSRLYDKARQQLVALADEANITLRQNYNRLAPRLAMQICRYAHARQFKRMRKALKKLKG